MKKSQVMTPWQRLVKLLKLDQKDILQVLYYAVFAGVVSLTLPLGIQAIINLIQGAQVSTSWIILVVLVTLGVVFGGLLQLMQMRITENIQQKIFTRASFEFAYRFPKIKMSELSAYYPPELANRFFDTLTVQKGLPKLLMDLPAAILQIILGLLLLSFYHPFFIAYGVLLILLIYVVFRYTAKRGLDTSLLESKSKYKVAHWLQEIARTVVSFKVSGGTRLALSKNDTLVEKYLKHRESHFKILVLQFKQMIVFKVLVTAGLLVIGGALVLNQKMNIGQFVASEIIILLIISSVEKLITGLESIYDVLTSLEKLGQVVDKPLENQEGSMPFTAAQGFDIELDNVSFSPTSNGPNILNNLSLTIPKKSRILITGANGSGKSTLLKLLGAVNLPHQGNIYINNINLSSVNPNNYRAKVGQALSEETPFEGTILENITFGHPDIDEKEVWWAINNIGLADFIKRQPNGLQSMINPEGKRLSDTVSRKLVLARSIVTKPLLLLLKDPLDHFELKERARIMNFLAAPEHPWSLIVSSQYSEWKNLNLNVLELSNGKIVNP